MDISNKNIVYVGGFGGIGMATCKQLLLKSPQHLVILDKSAQPTLLAELHKINQLTKVDFFEYDLTANIDKLREVFKQLIDVIPSIDILINGAGICDDSNPALTIQINLTGLINTTKVAMELMDKRIAGNNGGVIANIASVAGLEMFPRIPTYSATKAAVVSFTRSIAEFYAKTGVSTFAICPGVTDTALLPAIKEFFKVDQAAYTKAIAATPVQTAEECATGFVHIIETNKNGSVWILDVGNINEVEFANYWKLPEAFRVEN